MKLSISVPDPIWDEALAMSTITSPSLLVQYALRAYIQEQKRAAILRTIKTWDDGHPLPHELDTL